MEYKGYTARIEFDQEAGLLHGEVEGLRDVITFEATDVHELEMAFHASVDDYLEQCLEDGAEPEKPYSGKFLVRIDPRLHRDVAMAAARAGKSLNALMSDVFNHWIERDRQQRVPARPSAVNALAEPATRVPVFPTQPAPDVRAEILPRAQLWGHGGERTPASITPNTPSATRTPAAKPTKRKVA